MAGCVCQITMFENSHLARAISYCIVLNQSREQALRCCFLGKNQKYFERKIEHKMHKSLKFFCWF